MSEFDHWHPVLDTAQLKDKPVRVQLAGRYLSLFRGRDAQGKPQIGALDDCCVHRRMSLSQGSINAEGRLQCCYHGWTYGTDGVGESPGTPKMRVQAPRYETREAYGSVWLKSADAEAEFPLFDADGYQFVQSIRHVAEVPLEVVLDNFTEVEHTPTTHALLGYELTRMTEVETKVETTARSVRVFNGGPQKTIPKFVQAMFGIYAGDRFIDDWTTYYSPVYCVYDQYWLKQGTEEERATRWRIWVFFNPLDDNRTELVTIPFVRSQLPWPLSSVKLFKPLLLWFVGREIELDMTMLSRLADKSPGIEGMKLSRFDRVLGLHRERIASIYRGETNGTTHAAECSATIET